MNHSIYTADRGTHVKIVVLGILCACSVLIVGVYAHVGQLDLGTAPLVKAGGATVISGQMPAVH
jgi:cytochrome c-type biogenesis protein CcmH/NrfG